MLRFTIILAVVLLHGLISVGLAEAGWLRAWGAEAYGLLDVPAGDDFVAVDMRGDHALALRADGSLVGWGRNNGGEIDVPEGNDFAAVAAGVGFGFALRANGSLVGWGVNRDVPEGNDFAAIAGGAAMGWRCGTMGPWPPGAPTHSASWRFRRGTISWPSLPAWTTAWR